MEIMGYPRKQPAVAWLLIDLTWKVQVSRSIWWMLIATSHDRFPPNGGE